MEKGKIYSFDDIKKYASKHDFEKYFYGNNIIGQSIIILVNKTFEYTTSFILTSATSNEYYYECIYEDGFTDDFDAY